MKRATTIIAETLGWDVKEVSEYRYQRYTNPAVYSIGDFYLAVHPTKPKHNDVGGEWREHTDQFGARDTMTTIWICDATLSTGK
jgi:hypothetical protein